MTTFTFVNNSGDLLSANEVRTLSGNLSDSVEQSLTIHYDGPTNAPGIYLIPATTYGSIDQPTNTSVHENYNKLLSWGSDVLDGKGLYIKMLNEDGEEETYTFSYSEGSTFSNMIPLKGMENKEIAGQSTYTIGYINNNNSHTQRLYIGLQVADNLSSES